MINISELTNLEYNNNKATTNDADYLYLKIPYISDSVDNKIQRLFREEGVDIRIAHRTFTLRQALKPKNQTGICKRESCPVPPYRLCFQKGIVYKIVCNKCKEIYI